MKNLEGKGNKLKEVKLFGSPSKSNLALALPPPFSYTSSFLSYLVPFFSPCSAGKACLFKLTGEESQIRRQQRTVGITDDSAHTLSETEYYDDS
jgi:hypothetical protein